MYSERETEEFKQGYHYGEKMNLQEKAYPPKGLTEEQEVEWQKGVTAAICDRLG